MKTLKSKLQIFLTLVFIGFTVWWISFQHVVKAQGHSLQWFEGVYGFIALFGSIIGFIAARKWGGTKTILGKALLFFSLGLFLQEVGQQILNYYIYIAKAQVLYPSLDDAAYFSSTIAYLIGGIYLVKAVGAKYYLKRNKYRFFALLIPAILFILSFIVLLHHQQYDWNHHPLTAFLNLGYPLGDAAYISLAIIALLLSKNMQGGIMRPAFVVLMIALIIQFVADFTFLVMGNKNTYIAGNIDDYFYCLAYFITSTSMIMFLILNKQLRLPAASTKIQHAESN